MLRAAGSVLLLGRSHILPDEDDVTLSGELNPCTSRGARKDPTYGCQVMADAFRKRDQSSWRVDPRFGQRSGLLQPAEVAREPGQDGRRLTSRM